MISDNDNFIDFGVFDGDRPRARDFVNGYERSILLDFNVDGASADAYEAEGWNFMRWYIFIRCPIALALFV